MHLQASNEYAKTHQIELPGLLTSRPRAQNIQHYTSTHFLLLPYNPTRHCFRISVPGRKSQKGRVRWLAAVSTHDSRLYLKVLAGPGELDVTLCAVKQERRVLCEDLRW